MPKVLIVNLARKHAELLEGTGKLHKVRGVGLSMPRTAVLCSCVSVSRLKLTQYVTAVLCSCVSVNRLKVVLTVAELGRTRSEFNRRCTDETSEKIQADGNLSHAEELGSNLAMVSMLHLDG